MEVILNFVLICQIYITKSQSLSSSEHYFGNFDYFVDNYNFFSRILPQVKSLKQCSIIGNRFTRGFQRFIGYLWSKMASLLKMAIFSWRSSRELEPFGDFHICPNFGKYRQNYGKRSQIQSCGIHLII